MTEALIRPARMEDAADLQRCCYPEAGLEDVQEYLAWCLAQEKKGRLRRLVAEVEGQAVGNAQLTVWGQVGEIGSVAVAEGHRRRGLARQLITALLKEAQQRGLESAEIEVAHDQPAILAFYRRLGFQPAEEQENGSPLPTGGRSTILLRMELSGAFRREEG